MDLFGVGTPTARERVLSAAKGGRRKPAVEPTFPDGNATAGEPVYPPELPDVWNVPARLAHFVGRDALLDDLADGLRAGGSAAVCALSGMGGVGKTALAVEYAYRNAGRFDVVWWVAAENPDLVDGQLADLGAELGLGEGAGRVA
nr:NB-ARC domain-containing protein [Micromonospora sp. DSM 115978]